MESEAVVDGQDFLLGNAYGAAIVIVEPITVWDDGIERVVPAGQLQNDECRLLLNCGHQLPILRYTSWNSRVATIIDSISPTRCSAALSPRSSRKLPPLLAKSTSAVRVTSRIRSGPIRWTHASTSSSGVSSPMA